MRFSSRFLTIAVLATTAGALIQGCDSDRDYNEENAGKGGSSGQSMTAGKGGRGGSSGQSGSGRGGQAGNAGGDSAGDGGAFPGGAPGLAGDAGEAGVTGEAGGGVIGGRWGNSGSGGTEQAGEAGETTSAGAAGEAGRPSDGGSGGDASGGSGGSSGSGGSGGSGGSSGSGGSGGKACSDACASGDTRCTSGDLETCEQDGSGCWGWSEAEACPTNACASSTACLVCNNTCTAGQVDCQGSSLFQCVTDANGCRAFGGTATVCSGDTPVCDETDKRCECNASAASCVDSDTAKVCTSGVISTPNCTGSTPVCVDGLGCQPCTEHSQCPASACHLAGSKQGSCFSTSSVVSVSSVDALISNVNSVPSGGERVLKLSSATFFLQTDDLALANGGEVAIIGQSGSSITGGPNPPGDPRISVLNVETGIVYVSRVNFSGSASWTALSVSQGAELWFDDSFVSGYYRSLQSAGEVHVRRSALRSVTSGMYVRGGLLYMENSAIGPNGETVPGLSFDSTATTTIDLRYVTIAGSMNALNCINAVPPIGGLVRNSILSSWAGKAVEGGTNGSNCSAIQFQNNVADMSSFGTLIPWYNEAWFTNAPGGNFRLTSVGRTAIPTSAARGSADPLVDIDGQSRPTSGGFPGLDQ